MKLVMRMTAILAVVAVFFVFPAMAQNDVAAKTVSQKTRVVQPASADGERAEASEDPVEQIGAIEASVIQAGAEQAGFAQDGVAQAGVAQADVAKADVAKAGAGEKTAEKKPQAAYTGPRIAVKISHKGDDTIGLGFLTTLKEGFAKSLRYELTERSAKVLRLKITTRAEVPERPYFGSVYSVVWIYTEGEDVLDTYLGDTVGTMGPNEPHRLAAAIMGSTDKVVSKFSYLFE